MSVTVTPESFSLVEFDAAELAAIVERLLDSIGLPAGTDVRVEVDETTPLGRARVDRSTRSCSRSSPVRWRIRSAPAGSPPAGRPT